MSLKRWAVLAVCSIVLVILGYGGFIIYVSWPIHFGNVDKAGVFGDSFGVLTSLFSGLAFAGIVFTILMQKEELALQRDELKFTREELKNQVSATKHQNFESTFFQMLRIHNDIVNAIDIRSRGVVTTNGRDCFVVFYGRLKAFYMKCKQTDLGISEEKSIESSYEKFWEQNQNDLGHYFRYLYNIFKFIKENDIVNKKLYSNIVRAQLSDQELLVIFYNCLYVYGFEKFKPLAEEFSLFDNLPKNLLLALEHQKFFQPKAFG